MFFIVISIPIIGILLIVFIGLSNTRDLFIRQLYTKQKKRHSLNINANDSYLTIRMSAFSNLDGSKYIPNVTAIPLEDDEELMKCDIVSNFCDNDSIELRLDQDVEYDNETNV